MKLLSMALALCAALALSCSDATNEDTAWQSQASTFGYSVQDQWKTIPSVSTRWCRAYYLQATNGSAGSPIWGQTGAPLHGAVYDLFPPNIGAMPYSINGVPQGGHASAATICEDFSNWGFGSQASQSDDTNTAGYLVWGPESGQGPVGGSVALWNFPASFCYLNGMLGLSSPGEDVRVDPPAGWSGDWNLVVANGIPTIGASAKCVFPNRSWGYYGPVVANVGQTTQGPPYSNSVCAIQRVLGRLDSGSVTITKNTVTGNWQLTALGVLAQMGCMVF